MTIALSVLSQRYDDVEPCFIVSGVFYYNRIDTQLYKKKEFDAWMAAQTPPLVFGANEVGTLSAGFLATHDGIPPSTGAATPPAVPPVVVPPVVTGAPITLSVTKAPAATADDTGQVTIAGGPADKGYMINMVIKDAASAGDDVQNIPVAKGDTAAQVAVKVDAAIGDPNVTHAVAGAVVTVTPKVGSTIDKLTVSIT